MRLQSHLRHLFIALLTVAAVAVAASAEATVCAGTPFGTPSPNDFVDDSDALRWCLNTSGWSLIELDPGSPGYILDSTITLTRSGWTLRSSMAPTKATIKAGRPLFGHMLRSAAGGYTIEYIVFNGMVDYDSAGNPVAAGIAGDWRTQRNLCSAQGAHPGNLELFGNSITFRYNESTHSICGSGLGLSGSSLSIHDNYIAYNGRDKFHVEVGGAGFPCDISNDCAPWSDGITMLSCSNSSVTANVLVDNTDFQLLVGGGGGCDISYNQIYNGGKYAFAGLNVTDFNGGNHVGTQVHDNTITGAASDRLGSGLVVGSLFWPGGVQIPNAGTVRNNSVTGAKQNFVVSGVDAGWIHSNSFSSPQGTGAANACPVYDYIAYEYGPALLLQPGATPVSYVAGTCTSKPAPSVSITSPAHGSSFPAFSSFTVTATASSGSGFPIAGYTIAYRVNGSSAVVASQQPTPSWSYSGLGPGHYDFTVYARDTAGNYWVSSWVSIDLV